MARPALPLGTGTRVFTGARALFAFNGSIVGFASGVSGSEEIVYEQVDTLDHLEVREFAPTAYRTTLNCTMFRTISVTEADDAGADGVGPGSIKQQNIFPHLQDILVVQGVDAIIQDRVSGKIIGQWQQVKTASYNFNLQARSLTLTNVVFNAIRFFDESEVNVVASNG
jgi:hypothetical protein